MTSSVKSVSIKAITATSKPSKAAGVSDLILELELSEPIRLDLRAGVPLLLGNIGGAPVVGRYGTARGSMGTLDGIDHSDTRDAIDRAANDAPTSDRLLSTIGSVLRFQLSLPGLDWTGGSPHFLAEELQSNGAGLFDRWGVPIQVALPTAMVAMPLAGVDSTLMSAEGSPINAVTAASPAQNSVIAAELESMAANRMTSAPLLKLANYDDTGNSSNDQLSKDSSFDLLLAGQADGSTITYQLSSDGGNSWRSTVAAQRNLYNGTYQFRAKVTDAKGSIQYSNSIAVTVDRVAPGTTLSPKGVNQPDDAPLSAKFSSGQEFKNQFAFAALRDDGSVVSWGDANRGGQSSGVDFDGDGSSSSTSGTLRVSQLYSTTSAFAALRNDGSVVTWGDHAAGGLAAVTDAAGRPVAPVDFDGDGNPITSTGPLKVSQIFSTAGAFAAVRSDGSVVTWGNGAYGGLAAVIDGTGKPLSQFPVDFDGDGNPLTNTGPLRVSQIFSSGAAFAALRSNGSVVTWGQAAAGGLAATTINNRLVPIDFDGDGNPLTSTGPLKVSEIVSTLTAFAALRSDGSVVTWGNPAQGGDSSAVDFDGDGQLTSRRGSLTVAQVYATGSAFAALRSDGSVVTWGERSKGGDSQDIDFDGDGSTSSRTGTLQVAQIVSTRSAFAALRADGSVLTWGDPSGGGDSSAVDFDGDGSSTSRTGSLRVEQILATDSAFVALRSDGSVVSWGTSPLVGDTRGFLPGFDPGSAIEAGSAAIIQVASTQGASSQGSNTAGAIAVLLADGSVVTRGDQATGGDSSGTSGLQSGVRSLATPFLAPALARPSIRSITGDGLYGIGEQIILSVQYSEELAVTGSPRLKLETGAEDRYASFLGLQSTVFTNDTLLFSYSVEAGDSTNDLDVFSANSLDLNGGSITDRAGNPALLRLAEPGLTHSLAANAGIQIDGIVPTVTVSEVSFSADTGSNNNDLITSNPEQTISASLSQDLAIGDRLYGSLDAGVTWTDITNRVSGRTITWTNVVLPFDAITSPVVSFLPAVSSTIVFKVTDLAGNTGMPTGFSPYVLDSVAPSVAVSSVKFSADTGTVNDDLVTNQAAQTISASLSQDLAKGDRLYGSLDSGVTWTDITNSVSGRTITWTDAVLPSDAITRPVEPVLAAASGTIVFKVTDLAGNTGRPTGISPYVLDTVAPSAAISRVKFSADTGSNANDLVTNRANQTISATLSQELGKGDLLFGSLDNGKSWINITSKVKGIMVTWTQAVLPRAGSNTIVFKVTDLAGNTGRPTGISPYVLDTVAPSVAISRVKFSADTGTVNDDLVTNQAAQTISATLSQALAKGDRLFGSLNAGSTWSDITSKVNGRTITWTDAYLPSESSTIVFRVTDLAGNTGRPTGASPYVLDTSAPKPDLTVNEVSLSADTGSDGRDLVTNIAEQTISANLSRDLDQGDRLFGSLDAGNSWTDITKHVSGKAITWTDAVLAPGSSKIVFKVTDLAGNTGSFTGSSPYVLDTECKSPTAPDLIDSSDSGSSSDDNVTNGATATLTGYGEIGSKISLFDTDGATLLGTAIADTKTGSWTITTSTLSEGSHLLTAKAIDLAGNQSKSSPALAVIVDSTAPKVIISSDINTLTKGQTAVITFSFSEDPGDSFSWNGTSGDLSISGGSLSALSGSGLTRTAIFTPKENTNSIGSIAISTGQYSDAAGNLGGKYNLDLAINTLAPKALSTINTCIWQAGNTTTIKLQFTDVVTVSGRPYVDLLYKGLSYRAFYSGYDNRPGEFVYGSVLNFTHQGPVNFGSGETWLVDIKDNRINFNGGTITDSSGLAVSTATPLPWLSRLGDGTDQQLIGSDDNDLITGKRGIDTLTGGQGADTFIVLPGDALISGRSNPAFERITDFAIGTDSFVTRFSNGKSLPAGSVLQLGDLGPSLGATSIEEKLSAKAFMADSAAAITFQEASGTRTFLAVNDGNAGFQTGRDTIVEITGYTGSIGNLALFHCI